MLGLGGGRVIDENIGSKWLSTSGEWVDGNIVSLRKRGEDPGDVQCYIGFDKPSTEGKGGMTDAEGLAFSSIESEAETEMACV